jgi:death-on-curing protein
VARRRREPEWLSRIVIDAIHSDQLREHGGLPGVRDENLLESALARPRQKWHYEADTDVPMLAAAYAFGLVRTHPYRDGNKRIGFLAMATFLGINGYEFEAPDGEVVAEFVAPAKSSVNESALADWVRQYAVKAQRSSS